jgi:hypothetical protein
MAHLQCLTVFFAYFLLIISTAICKEHKSCDPLILATWNIGLEEKQATERTPLIIDAILNSDANIIGLQEAWGGPQILRTIYQAVKSKYPNFEVVDDNMRHYISANRVPNQVYAPACPASDITSFEICFFSKLFCIQWCTAIYMCRESMFDTICYALQKFNMLGMYL